MDVADTDVVELAVPADPRYVEVAVRAVEALAERAGLDHVDLATRRDLVRELLAHRLAESGNGVVLHFEVGDGYLGLRFDDALPE